MHLALGQITLKSGSTTTAMAWILFVSKTQQWIWWVQSNFWSCNCSFWIQTNYLKIEKSQAIATFISALLLDPSSKQFNYNHTGKSRPLKHKRLWDGRWSKLSETSKGEKSFKLIDLSKWIREFYLKGNTNLSQSANTLIFHENKLTNK